MSYPFTIPFVTKGYGLREEDLNEIIEMERLKDVSKRFSGPIQRIQRKFNSKTKIRIIEFNELSGANVESEDWFRRRIDGQRHIFFSHINSNKDCCVLFLYSGFDAKQKLFSERILPHEFAHHYQWVSENFPCFLPKSTPKEFLPQFATTYEIGPKVGSVYIDDISLFDNLITIMNDLSERIADFVCEGILKEKGFGESILEEYLRGRNQDPAKNISIQRETMAPIRYFRRLALRDVAEWHAMLCLAYPNDQTLKKMLTYDKKWIVKLNKKYDKAKYAFNEIYKISLNTNYTSFKKVRNAISYIKKVTNLLGIKIRTKEKW